MWRSGEGVGVGAEWSGVREEECVSDERVAAVQARRGCSVSGSASPAAPPVPPPSPRCGLPAQVRPNHGAAWCCAGAGGRSQGGKAAGMPGLKGCGCSWVLRVTAPWGRFEAWPQGLGALGSGAGGCSDVSPPFS